MDLNCIPNSHTFMLSEKKNFIISFTCKVSVPSASVTSVVIHSLAPHYLGCCVLYLVILMNLSFNLSWRIKVLHHRQARVARKQRFEYICWSSFYCVVLQPCATSDGLGFNKAHFGCSGYQTMHTNHYACLLNTGYANK